MVRYRRLQRLGGGASGRAFRPPRRGLQNAGYGHVGAAEELSDAELRRQLDVNLFGVINVTRAVLPHMRRRRSGQLVQMSSLNGVEGLAGGAYYAASKFGIEGFSESLAGEVAHLGIKVTIVEPGPFRTRFLDDRSAKWSEPMSDYVDSGDPERAAAAIVQAVTAARPPQRLALGPMALEHARSVLDARRQELDAWAGLGAATDFPPAEALVHQAYSAFNARDVEAGVALMHAEVDWPDVPAGGFVHGRDQVRKHWREQFGQVDPHIDVARVRQTGDGRVEAEVRQVVRRLDGSGLSDDRQLHVFTIANDRIRRMEVKPPAARVRAPAGSSRPYPTG